jgi:hypothetical protein
MRPASARVHPDGALPSPEEIKDWDREYERLVEDVGRFGFSEEKTGHTCAGS